MSRPAASRPAVALPEADWTAALDALTAAGSIALACHVSPDGDALGSMLGLGLALRRLGLEVVCGFSGAGDAPLPPVYSWLPGQELLGTLPEAPDLLVTLDTSSVDRLGELAPLAQRAGVVLVIDHHARGDGFGGLRLVDPHAAATAVVVEELVRRLGVGLDADIAACLYLGLTTDTGSFRFAATTPAVHEVAARLLATGIRHDVIARRVFDTNPIGYLRVLGAALGRACLEPDAVGGLGLVWTHTTAEELEANGVGFDETEAIIGTVRTTAEAEVAVVLKVDTDGSYKVSTRSKGAVDVGAVCAGLGGGGHLFAAGYTSYDGIETTMARLRAALDAVEHLPA